MAETKYGKYIVRNPIPIMPGGLANHPKGKKRSAEGNIWLNKDTVPGSPLALTVARTYAVPDPQPFIVSHVHEVDEVVLFLAQTQDGDLGTEVTILMGEEGEKHTFDHTTLVYFPKGLKHCPIYYGPFKEGKQFFLIAFLVQPDYF